MYVLRGLTCVGHWLDPNIERTDIRSLFASLITELHATLPENRPSAFVLEQAYIDSPKDEIFNILCSPEAEATPMRKKPTIYRPLPSVILRFNKYVMSCQSKCLSHRLIVTYIAFRRALSDEPELRQKEYLQELSKYIESGNYKSTESTEPKEQDSDDV